MASVGDVDDSIGRPLCAPGVMIMIGRHYAFSECLRWREHAGQSQRHKRRDTSQRGPLMSPPEELIRLLPPCLHWHPDGEIRLVGHRIGLYHFVYYYNQGFTAEMILCQFPTLELATIHKVIAFYLDHREEVDRYAAKYQTELDHLAAPAQFRRA